MCAAIDTAITQFLFLGTTCRKRQNSIFIDEQVTANRYDILSFLPKSIGG